MIDYIINQDKALLIYLNSLGSTTYDSFWLSITNKYLWLPLYILVLLSLLRYFGLKKTLYTLFIVALLVTFTDQFVNLIKFTFARLRPSKDPSMQNLIRVVKYSGGYSFVSGHATNSMAVSTFIILCLKQNFKPIYSILIWPLLFAYSRVYLGVHYPIDITLGLILGIIIGQLFFKLNQYILSKISFIY